MGVGGTGNPQQVPKVAVAVATFRRPGSLARLLESLASQRLGGTEAEIAVFVVDNDGEGSARPVVEAAQGDFPWRLAYDVEPERNIAAARNRGVALSLSWGANWVAFIDDDEVADAGWLGKLLETAVRFDADVVGGAIRPHFEDGIAEWVVRGGFFDEAPLPTGATLKMAYTGNALVAARLLRPDEGPFDPSFGRSGGEDSHFFLRIQRAGARMVRANEAVTEEWIPATRANTRWLVMRAFRVGAATAACEKAVLPIHRSVVLRAAKGVGRMVEGALRLPLSLFGGPAARTRALRKIAHGAGCLAGLAGVRYREYEAVHGG